MALLVDLCRAVAIVDRLGDDAVRADLVDHRHDRRPGSTGDCRAGRAAAQALLGPVGGTFADRYNRRMLMIVSNMVSAFCIVVLIALFLSGHIALWHIYTAMFVRSAATAFQLPAAAASEAMLVPQHFLPRAAGLNQTLMGIVTVAAAPLGALAIGVMPVGMALWIDVGTGTCLPRA